MNEYEQPAAIFYDSLGPGIKGDVDFLVAEAKNSGSPVMELGCGTGRILVPVAEAGIDVVGLDSSSAMLALARKKLKELDPEVSKRIELVEADMRTFELPGRFRLIMIPYRSFQHILDPEEQRQALTVIRRHLTAKGRFILNLRDPDPREMASAMGSERGTLKRQGIFAHPEHGGNVVVWESEILHAARQVSEHHLVFEELDADFSTIARHHVVTKIRYTYRYEMQYLLELCGFRVEALYGDFQRGSFRHGREQIWIASKR